MNEIELLDILEQIQILTERADVVTTEIITNHGFAEPPDPYKAINFMKGLDTSKHAEQSFKWFANCNLVFRFVDIANDYIQRIAELSKAAVNAK